MPAVRSLLAVKNGKMGNFIAHFDLPAIKTCPGSSHVCRSFCYSTHGRFMTKRVKDRLAWCYRQSLRDDFVERIVAEIRSCGALVVRWHVAGDLYSAEYGRKILAVMRSCGKVRFYLYTRSYRVESIAPVLAEMASLPNVRIWFSCDAETGEPETVPAGVRLCFMQHAESAKPEKSELVFRVRGVRQKPRDGLPVICPQETNKKVNCGACGICWRD